MEKIALFFEGRPNFGEDKIRYNNSLKRDFELMRSIFLKEGYKIVEENFEGFFDKVNSYSKKGDLAIYYSGHGKDSKFEGYSVQSFLDNLENNSYKKMIILDSCLEGEGYGKFNLPKNSSIITSQTIGRDSSLAMILWDYVFARKNKLSSLSKKSFEDMKHNWVYFKENKNGNA